MEQLTQIRKDVLNRIMSHEIIQRIGTGRVTRDEYARYMSDVYYYAQHSSQVIGFAASRLVSRHPEMANYLFTHAQEELGHDAWAKSDLVDLGRREEEIAAVTPSHACQQMVAMEYFYSCHDDPVGLFGWMYVLECLGGDAASGLADGLDAALQLGGKGVYFLAGHGEADEHHSEDLTNVISHADLSNAEQGCITNVMAMSISCYLGILDHALTASP